MVTVSRPEMMVVLVPVLPRLSVTEVGTLGQAETETMMVSPAATDEDREAVRVVALALILETLWIKATGLGTATVKERVAVPVPRLLAAERATLEAPKAVGVPEIRPLAVLTESPAGSPVALKLVGVFEAVI